MQFIGIGNTSYAAASTFEKVFKGDYSETIKLAYINSLITDPYHGIDYIDSGYDLSILNHKQYKKMILTIAQSIYSMRLIKSDRVNLTKKEYDIALNSVSSNNREIDTLRTFELTDKERHKIFTSILNKRDERTIICTIINKKDIRLQQHEVKHLVYFVVQDKNYMIANILNKYYHQEIKLLNSELLDQFEAMIVAYNLFKD